MSLTIEIGCAAAATLALFGAPSLVLARVSGLGAVGRTIAGMALRLLLVSTLAVALALAGPEHRVARLLTIATTYFAAALLDGVRRFRKRESVACSAR